MSYSFSYPPELSQDKVNFITEFYRTSDSRDVDQYLNFLTSDVNFIMGLNAVTGEAAVRKIRETMWGGVETRAHNPEKAYLGDSQANEVMLHGTVSYGLKNGTQVDNVGFAARMVFEQRDSSDLKLSRYQVWLDGTPLSTALKAQAAEQG